MEPVEMSIEFIIKLFAAPHGMGLEDWKTVSEIVANGLQALAVVAGVGAIWAWLYQRKDRATDILLKLEEKFDQPIIKEGRACLEENHRFKTLGPWLDYYVKKAQGRKAEVPSEAPDGRGNARKEPGLADFIGALLGWRCESSDEAPSARGPAPANQPVCEVEALDALLRFYVVLYGVREAKQVPDAPLLACYRYWLALYFHKDRKAFKRYVDQFFPTLRKWLADDKWNKGKNRFFRPEDFFEIEPG